MRQLLALRHLLAFGLALVAVCPLSARAQTAGAAGMDDVALRPGDMLRIEVWRQAELSGEFMIAADGTPVHPLYREVVVAGVPLEEAQRRVRAFLSDYEANPRFVMVPLLRVAVGGEVRQPNLYPLPPHTTIAEAVALAGGPTDRGRLDRVRLIRDGSERRLDLTRVEPGMAQLRVRSGDQILVERRVDVFRDYIAPIGSLAAAAAAIAGVIIQLN